MGLQFTPGSAQAQPQTEVATTATVTAVSDAALEAKIEEVKNFNIVVKTDEIKQQLATSDEIDKLVSTINVNDSNTIVKFGAEAADEISKASDQVLNSMSISQINDTGVMLKNLAAIMDQFDIKEIQDDKPGFFGNLKKKIEKILSKYDTMGKEIDKIYVQLKQYENEIQQANTKLDAMYDANIGYYQQLVKYIMAGEQGVKELDAFIADYQKKVAENPDDGTIRMDLSNLQQMREILDQRVMDLKIAENVALQSVPMLKTMEYSNLNLVRKINSAFIITMPIFKQALAQAIMLKRQKIQAESLAALDEKTNEMLLKNAQNTVEQSKMIASMSATSSIQVETLQKTWETIVNGIDEVQAIQDQAREKRKADAVALEQIKAEYKAKMKA
ncbi:MAG: toxic anion resistance protein [Oscillospiraceae bacterium]|nr:toxic anion resistance protein [Oscillospiraceae bacterium]MCH5207257.1 toxic anion resistance protein [Oscillospiraceae bacterium]